MVLSAACYNIKLTLPIADNEIFLLLFVYLFKARASAPLSSNPTLRVPILNEMLRNLKITLIIPE